MRMGGMPRQESAGVPVASLLFAPSDVPNALL